MANSNQICRTCLKPYSLMIPLFTDATLPQKIQALSSVVVSPIGNLPTVVCAKCVVNISSAFNVRQILINTDATLKRAINRRAIKKLTHKFKVDDKSDPLSGFFKDDQKQSTPNQASMVASKIYNNLEDSNCTNPNINGNDCGDTINPVKIEIKPTLLKTGSASDLSSNLIKLEASTPKTSPSSIAENTLWEECDVLLQTRDISVTVLEKDQTALAAVTVIDPAAEPSGNHLTILLCHVCGKVLDRSNFSRHVLSHTEAPVNCKICGKVVKNSLSLRYHMDMHKPAQRVCQYCSKVFKHHSSFAQHLNTHTGKRRYTCHICDKTFTSSKTCKRHQMIHTGERPYSCEYCKKDFTNRSSLKTHIRQHTNERPYTCEHCSMGFPQKVSLQTHLRSQHSETITV